ncbi:MAG: DNA recombination protein RmuC [Bacteroidaceae bacterium]|nr:DNA recombination protein RmuC [Bacteroidaceae bacterium]
MLIAYLLLSTAAGLAIGYLIANRATQRHMQKCAELQSQLSSSEARLQTAQQQAEAQKEQHAQTLKTQQYAFEQSILRERETAEKMLNEAKASYRESLEAMKARFAQMAEEALKERANELKQTNEESIAHLVTPVREDLQKMQQSVTQAREQAAAQKASMDKTIEGLLRHTQEVERNAANLAQALQSNGKMQGDWGEQLLAGILENSGLRPGIEFEVQENVKDEEGTNHRPDVIVNCPGKRRIIIDSKVSLTAYLNYAGAQNREQVEQAQKDNLRSIRAHIDELAKKQYDKLVPGALSQVLMFIPNEGSYILALRTDPQIGQYAYKKGIILINPTNLMLALQMIFNLWQTERQNKNTEKVTRQAADLYDKFATFVEKFDKIRGSIVSLQANTEDAYKSLTTGTGNIVRRLEGLRQMGITPKKQLSEELTEAAQDGAHLPSEEQ